MMIITASMEGKHCGVIILCDQLLYTVYERLTFGFSFTEHQVSSPINILMFGFRDVYLSSALVLTFWKASWRGTWWVWKAFENEDILLWINIIVSYGRCLTFLMVLITFGFHDEVTGFQVHYVSLAAPFNDGCLDDSIIGFKIINAFKRLKQQQTLK